MSSSVNPQIAALRKQIAQLESAGRRHLGVLPFGLESVDRKIPGGGLPSIPMAGCSWST